MYVVGAKPPERLAGDDAKEQVILVYTATELELLKLAGTERDARTSVSVELGQQIGDDVLLVIALDYHAVDTGTKRAQVRGQCDAGRHEPVEGHVPEAVYHWFRIRRSAVGAAAVYLFGQLERVRDRVFD